MVHLRTNLSLAHLEVHASKGSTHRFWDIWLYPRIMREFLFLSHEPSCLRYGSDPRLWILRPYIVVSLLLRRKRREIAAIR